MTRTATQMARLQEAAGYFPVYTRPIPGEMDESYPLRRGCFACQHTGKSSLQSDHRFATVWFNAVNAGSKISKNLIQPLGAIVVDLNDKASVSTADSSIIPLLRDASTTFPKLWIYYITTNAFQGAESPYVRLFADRDGNVEHINSRISLWNNLLTDEEKDDKPTDITLTIQGNWGKGLYLDPSTPPKGLAVSPEQLITYSKSAQNKLLQQVQGEQQLTRIQPLKEQTPKKEKLIEAKGGQSYTQVLQDQAYQAITQSINTNVWNTLTANPWALGPDESEEDF